MPNFVGDYRHPDVRRYESIERQHMLYQKIPGMVYALEEAGQLVEVSDPCLQLLGYTRAELLGRPGLAFMSAATQARLHNLYCAALHTQGQLREVECEFVKKDGQFVSLLLSVTAERNSTGEIVRSLGVLTDGAQRLQAQHVLHEVLAGTAALTGDDFFRSLVSQLARSLGAMYAMVTECTNQSLTRLRTLACYKYDNFIEQFEYDLTGGPCEGVIKSGLCVYPRLRELFPKEDQQAYLGVAIHDSRGHVIGHLVVEDDKPWYPGPYDIDILKLFAARAGAELERLRIDAALAERERQLRLLSEQLTDTNRSLERLVNERTREIERRRQVAESLRDMVAILNSERPLPEILDYIVATATRLLGTDSGAIFILQADQRTIALQASRGLPTTFATNLAIPLERSFLGLALLKGGPLVIANLGAALAEQNIALDEGQRTVLGTHYQVLLAVPLIRQHPSNQLEDVYGGIALYFAEPRHFADEEIELVVAFGAQAALAIENARLRQQAAQGAIVEERSRLARELHDSVTQSLYSLTLLAEGWRRMARAGRLPQVEEALQELGELGQQALKEMRLLIYELRPPALEQEGLIGALHQRLAAVEKRAGVEVRLLAEDALDLPVEIEAGLYRIAQEALNNTLKHAAATAVTISVRAGTEQITLEICDNGKGFELGATQQSGGLGLMSIRERVAQMNGHLTLLSAPGAGTTVLISIPHALRSAR